MDGVIVGVALTVVTSVGVAFGTMLKERADMARDACPRCGAQRSILMRAVDDMSPSEPRFVCPRCGYPDPLHEPT